MREGWSRGWADSISGLFMHHRQMGMWSPCCRHWRTGRQRTRPVWTNANCTTRVNDYYGMIKRGDVGVDRQYSCCNGTRRCAERGRNVGRRMPTWAPGLLIPCGLGCASAGSVASKAPCICSGIGHSRDDTCNVSIITPLPDASVDVIGRAVLGQQPAVQGEKKNDSFWLSGGQRWRRTLQASTSVPRQHAADLEKPVCTKISCARHTATGHA